MRTCGLCGGQMVFETRPVKHEAESVCHLPLMVALEAWHCVACGTFLLGYNQALKLDEAYEEWVKKEKK